MSEQNKLEQLIERHGMYSGANELGKNLRSESVDEREKAREILKNYQTANGIFIPEDQSMPEEFYDNTAIAIKAESGRDNYWNSEKESCVSELSSEILEKNFLGITPVKLEGRQKNSKKHNDAYKLHESFRELMEINQGYDENEIHESKLYEVALEETEKNVRKRLEDDAYLNNKDKSLVLRASASALRVSSVARATTGKMQMERGSELINYFENSEGYSAGEYAKENLIYNKNIDESIGQVVEIYSAMSK